MSFRHGGWSRHDLPVHLAPRPHVVVGLLNRRAQFLRRDALKRRLVQEVPEGYVAMQEATKRLGVTRERVRQIEGEALNKLRHLMAKVDGSSTLAA